MNQKRQPPKWAVLAAKLLVFAAVIGFVSFSVYSFQKKKAAEQAAKERTEMMVQTDSGTADSSIRTYQGKQYKLNSLNPVLSSVSESTQAER